MKKVILFISSMIMLLAFGAVSAQQATDSVPSAANQEAASTPWWNDRVFYEVFVRSFYDSNGDGIGDLQGLIQKLDYLNDGDPKTTTDLGVTGLWLMPIMASPSYHGYNSTDYKAVNPDYGTNDDFKQLIMEAHKRGIAVIVDLVINHTSDQHPWFKASAAGDPKYANWYIWNDQAPSYLGPWGEQVWYPLAGRFYYAIFCGCQPDLNYTNPDVTAAMDDVANYWLTDMGADGFRLDALQHIIEDGQKQQDTPATRQWATAFHQYIDSVKPNALTVGEVNNSDFVSSAYVPKGADLTFDFDFATAMVNTAKQGSNNTMISLQKRVNGLTPNGQYAAFLTNHDQPRVYNDLLNVYKVKVAADLLMTQPGVPFIYYGEEIGMSGTKPDENIRTPMQWDNTAVTNGFTTGTPWEPLDGKASVAAGNVATESTYPDSLLNHYRNLIHLRNTHPSLQHGDFTPVKSDSNHVYSFLRHSGAETLLVLINLTGDPISDYGLSLDKGFGGGQGSLVEGTGDLTQPTVDANGGFSGYLPLAQLAPYSLTVIQFTS